MATASELGFQSINKTRKDKTGQFHKARRCALFFNLRDGRFDVLNPQIVILSLG